MNQITIEDLQTPYGYKEKFWMIDGKSLPEYLSMWASESQDNYFKSMEPFEGLVPAWDKELDWNGDVRFVWKLIGMDSVVMPLLLCAEDLDFSCIVIVVEVEKTKEFVYWNRIGYVLHEHENFEEEKKSGILNIKAYTEEDWERYGDNIALEKVDSPIWKEWISNNWEEELYRRRMNYTLPYFQKEGNICWIKNADWKFDKTEYDHMVGLFWNIQTKKQLENFTEKML